MPLPVVYVDELTRKFGDFVAVDHVSFEVNPGEIVGYLGGWSERFWQNHHHPYVARSAGAHFRQRYRSRF